MFVCIIEFGYMVKIMFEFEKWNCKVIGFSVDSVVDYNKWVEDIVDVVGVKFSYLMIVDFDFKVVKFYNMLFEDVGFLLEGCIVVDNFIVWMVFVIGLDK